MGAWVAIGLALASCGIGGQVDKAGNEDTGVASGIVQVAPEDRIAGPEVSGANLEGDAVDVAGWRGKVVVVNVWGSWCPPCRAETPDLNRAARETAPDVEFLGIAVRESAATSLAFARKEKVPYPSISDSGGTLLREFAEPLPAVAVPTTYVLDRQGRVAVRVLDQVTYSTLTALIEDVQAEGADAP
ncbi:TlpA family protein disulfide reductase [Aeromicrobium sp. CTD01-1L150]|uniref:TlpA family protein disulfide reductase n=1 Tax=Aeromicrobium sp. CTD01-1L150 TaxID=3341830 RepID=UPI0035BF4F22